ncbi:hypothetical protein IC229_30990 [Spirosoma sp. BT702]|uniref:Uncharacterized protein n=1 Tax=Spirosoma profusum TaxID=2771354 RepID=A0A927AVB6_9BACT|nr:hypothetical protein [Spirosoma profusum]MBD2705093.1 hypothetical protein [Spirosoma profusum]
METIETKPKDYSHILGWGIDADPKNDPTYPIKNRTDRDGVPVEQKGYTWERPSQQPVDIEVLHSNERPNVSAVFGTSVPPSGLSGHIRRFAFRFSESEYGHWLPLLIADRVNVVEGIIDDLKQSRVPNIFAEKGMKADWKYNRQGLLRQALIGVVVTATVFAFLSRKKRPHKA